MQRIVGDRADIRLEPNVIAPDTASVDFRPYGFRPALRIGNSLLTLGGVTVGDSNRILHEILGRFWRIQGSESPQNRPLL